MREHLYWIMVRLLCMQFLEVLELLLAMGGI